MQIRKPYPFVILCACFLTSGTASLAAPPNVLLVMVDDLGFSDLGCYGSEIETPNLDSLADGGIRFSQFYNTAKCHSSRVSLLSGQYCLAAGDTALTHAVTSAEVLGQNGYFTAMTGKWHLKQEPTDFGFQRYFGHLSGACNYFLGDKTFRLNGEAWRVPQEGFYTTVANVDYGLEFLKEAESTRKPWFLYVAMNAPHAPLQALPQDYAKYEGKYDVGWDSIREARVAKQKSLEIIAKDTQASPRPVHVPAWETLSEPRRRFEAARMTALAGMIDRVDQEIGRLLRYLQDTRQLDDTLIWFVSDNGACPYDRSSSNINEKPTNGSVSWSDSTGWAWARNSPFRYYKQNQYEGGIGTPAIVHWPNGLKPKPGSIRREPAHLIDILPTLADVTGSDIPTDHADRDLRNVSGISLRPIFEGNSIQRNDPIHFLFASDRGLRDGNWKAVSFRSGRWELYNLRDDRTELNNLANDEPERLNLMVDQWFEMASEVLHARGRSLAPVKNDQITQIHPEWTNFERDPRDRIRGSGIAQKNRKAKQSGGIRARKNTKLQAKERQLVLTFDGEDGGIAMDSLPSDLPSGPYELSFELNSNALGNGDVFFTTEAKTVLPNGEQISFPVIADGNWHTHVIELAAERRIHKLRLDVGEGRGTATIRGLCLNDKDGETLMRWPAKSK